MNIFKTYFFGLLTGVMLAFAFPPFPFHLLAFFAFLPILHLLDSNIKKPYLLIYLTFFLYHGITNHWISSWQPDCDPYLLASGIAVWLIHPFFFMFPFFLYRLIQKKYSSNSALWMFPAIWVTFEWLHSFGDLAYPWLTIGYSQVDNTKWVQFADITGVWGVSFVIVLANIIIYKILLNIKNPRNSNLNLIIALWNKKTARLTALLLLISAVPFVYSMFVLPEYDHNLLLRNNKTIKAGLIQPNINPWKKWETNTLSQIMKHKTIQDSLQNTIKDIDLMVWSETAVTLLSLEVNARHDFAFIQEDLDSADNALLTGFADIYFYKKDEPHSKLAKKYRSDANLYYDSFNSAVVVNPAFSKIKPQVYHKMKLTPFGERIPYVEIFTFAIKWLEWGVGISSWAIGNDQHTMRIKTKKVNTEVGSIICIESIYPHFVANFVDLGAQFLTIITNDAWYDHTMGPEQHYDIARMRAIETKRYIARCANTGVSGFILPSGETLSRAPQYIETGIADKLALLESKTFYVKNGDWLPWASFLATIIFTGYSLIPRKNKNSL